MHVDEVDEGIVFVFRPFDGFGLPGFRYELLNSNGMECIDLI